MRRALLEVDGVVSADVSYDEALAVVRFRPESVSAPQMIDAVDAAGFRAFWLEDDDSDS